MPEYRIPMNSFESGRRWDELNDFTRGYIEAVFFTNASCADDGDLEGAGFFELSPAALEAIQEECAEWQGANSELLRQACEQPDYDMERAGNDYWYTRNGHGTGFWDRGLGDIGEALSKAARYSSRDIYRGDDGAIHYGAG
jgi:hypothetical protein